MALLHVQCHHWFLANFSALVDIDAGDEIVFVVGELNINFGSHLHYHNLVAHRHRIDMFPLETSSNSQCGGFSQSDGSTRMTVCENGLGRSISGKLLEVRQTNNNIPGRHSVVVYCQQ